MKEKKRKKTTFYIGGVLGERHGDFEGKREKKFYISGVLGERHGDFEGKRGVEWWWHIDLHREKKT